MGALAENEVNDPQLLGYGCPGRERSEPTSTARVWVNVNNLTDYKKIINLKKLMIF